jgi:hypothetical protein
MRAAIAVADDSLVSTSTLIVGVATAGAAKGEIMVIGVAGFV